MAVSFSEKVHGVAETEGGDHSKRSERLEEHAYSRGGIWILDIFYKSRSETLCARFPKVDIVGVKRFLGNHMRAIFL